MGCVLGNDSNWLPSELTNDKKWQYLICFANKFSATMANRDETGQQFPFCLKPVTSRRPWNIYVFCKVMHIHALELSISSKYKRLQVRDIDMFKTRRLSIRWIVSIFYHLKVELAENRYKCIATLVVKAQSHFMCGGFYGNYHIFIKDIFMFTK